MESTENKKPFAAANASASDGANASASEPFVATPSATAEPSADTTARVES